MDLIARIDSWGRSAPQRIAHRSGERQLTYGELIRQSNALAARLAVELGGDRTPIVVLGHKEPEVLVAYLGAIKAGHPYVPADSVLPARRVERIVELSGARLTLTAAAVAERSVGPGGAVARGMGPDDPFYIMFTSGSTGEPKGVVITLGNLTSFLDWMLAEQAPAEGEVFLNQVPYSFDVGDGHLPWSVNRRNRRQCHPRRCG